jgi:polysaccharide export outer membrane protein
MVRRKQHNPHVGDEMRNRRLEAVALLVLPLLVPGCAAKTSTGAPVPVVEASGVNGDSSARPPVAGPATQQMSADRPIGAADLLEITVFEVPELSRTVRVSESGEISVPLLGATAAAGKTPRQLEASLRAQLQRSYMHDPQVTVEVKELGTPPIYVIGEVNQPGAFVATGRSTLTVLRAVAMAEGTKPTAAGKLYVIRTGPGGDRVQLQVSMKDVVRGKSPDLALQANDVVYVPKSTERSLALGAIDVLVRTVTFRTVF